MLDTAKWSYRQRWQQQRIFKYWQRIYMKILVLNLCKAYGWVIKATSYNKLNHFPAGALKCPLSLHTLQSISYPKIWASSPMLAELSFQSSAQIKDANILTSMFPRHQNNKFTFYHSTNHTALSNTEFKTKEHSVGDQWQFRTAHFVENLQWLEGIDKLQCLPCAWAGSTLIWYNHFLFVIFHIYTKHIHVIYFWTVWLFM